jgi:WD40 repeat protein
VQAVEWLSSDVIASGLRNSSVFLYDVRSGENSLRLQHSQSVTKIRKVDLWRIVVGGYNSVS